MYRQEVLLRRKQSGGKELAGSGGGFRYEREVGKKVAARAHAIGDEAGWAQVGDETGFVLRRMDGRYRAAASLGHRP